MFANTKESGLEMLIVKWLVEHNGYEEGSNADYNKEYAIDETRLFRFLQDTQPEQMDKLGVFKFEQKKRQFLNRLQGEIAKRGIIDVLRNGIKVYPVDLIMFYLTPTENNAKAREMFEKNIFSVTRQLRYAQDAGKLALDMCVFINGLPVITFELKNQLTKQNVDDAVQQYKDDRDPRESLFTFKRCMVHFAVDDYGLCEFDGTPLYELPASDVTKSEWGSYNFIHAKGEVASFLKSCADYWLTDYHFDGLRFDAISNIIYWRGRQECGVNDRALQFVQSLNEGLHERHPHVVLYAEDSTSFLKVTAPVQYEGLGFDYKWDLGFMNDTLRFFAYSPQERREHYQDLLFSMHYFYNELYLLEFSHDEVVHGKKTIVDKMYGEYEEKFAQCRTLFLYMFTHPGKKLNFMGNEIGQFREWAEYRPQDFDILASYPMHQMFTRYMKDLNHIYLSHPALYEGEYNSDCYQCVVGDRAWDLVYAYTRHAGEEQILTVFNFGDVPYRNYLVKLPGNHELVELVNTDAVIYGGESVTGRRILIRNGQCIIDLPAYSGCLFRVE